MTATASLLKRAFYVWTCFQINQIVIDDRFTLVI